MNRSMMPLIAGVLGFILLVIGSVGALIFINLPIETSTQNELPGISIQPDGTWENSTVTVNGLVRSFRFHHNPTIYYINRYNYKHGVFVNDRPVFSAPSFNLPEDGSVTRYKKNGSTLFTDRDFSFCVVLLRGAQETCQLVVSPADSASEAAAVLEQLLRDGQDEAGWNDDLARIRQFLANLVWD